jgi:hypothetical protein
MPVTFKHVAANRAVGVGAAPFLCGVNHVSSYIFWDKYPAEVYRKINEQVGLT